MFIRTIITRWIVWTPVALVFSVSIALHCTLPANPSLNPENVEIIFVDSRTAKNQILIGDSLTFKIAVRLPNLVDSLQVRAKDSILVTLYKLYDTVELSLLPGVPGDLSLTITGYCQRSIVKETSKKFLVRNIIIAVTKGPQDYTTIDGGSAVFIVTATGMPVPSIQWFRDTVAITNATSDTLRIDIVSSSMNGSTYYVKLTNSVDTLWSEKAVLTVKNVVCRWGEMRWNDAVWW